MRIKFINAYLLIAAFFLLGITAEAQTHTFTYQGRLADNMTSASGAYDLQFSLYNAVSGGTQIDTTQTMTGVAVNDGVFTVQLTFGDLSFSSGDARFLQIAVKGPSDAEYTTLMPRQQITSAPYAIRASTANAASTALNAFQLAGVSANQYLTVDSGIRNSTTPQNPANFNISGTGTANLLTANTVNAETQYNLDGGRYIFGNESSVFIGPSAGPSSTGTTQGNTAVGAEAGTALVSSSSSNSFFGSRAGANLSQGNNNSFFGRRAGWAFFSGDNNTFIGNGAAGGTNLTASDGNTFIGGSAGHDTFGGFNTFVGFESGATGASNRNTVLGWRAKVSPGLSFATAIGADSVAVNSNSVILGRTSGEDTVEVPGKIKIFQLGPAGATQLCRNGDNEVSGCSSSLRYKSNIHPFTSGLSLMNQLRPISFDWTAGGMKDVGFGAEDVAKISPLLVTYNAQGEVEGVKYDRFSVLFVNAFREQQSQIERQAAENQKLAGQIEMLQKSVGEQATMINTLKALVCGQNRQADVCGEM